MNIKAFFLIVALGAASVAGAQQLAFPGAEGFGAYATGGRGGQVVHVTNLKASGAGSLADAVSKSGRIVVFDVGGVIDITGSSITIASNVTVAGQTAPGEGITIYGGRVIASGAKNVILRYLRMRGGKSVNSSKCTLTLDNCENFIMDHCSVSWGPWDNVHIKDANNITWQNCIISEGIEPQRFGSITDGTRNWTVHHCLWSDNKSRNPKMKCYIQYYNNVVYNYAMGIVGGHSSADNYQDVMNNYFIAGPEGSYKYFDQWTETDHLYSVGNYYDGNCDGQLNGTLITDYNGATAMSKPYFTSSLTVQMETAAEAYASVVSHVGASRVRDSHDLRIISQLTSLGKEGAFIANEDNVGGIGTLAGGSRETDSDNDGMPDAWEREYGLNPSSNDANAYTIGGGYTNIEHYINSLAEKGSSVACPQNVKAQLTSKTTVRLTWTNIETEATSIVLEQSENGKDFEEIKRLSGKAVSTFVTGLTADKVYYFRLKTICEEAESGYSAVVSVNNDYMLPGRGTPAGTTTFKPKEGMLYRIINYASVPYNSSTNLNGTPKYLVCNDNGSLGTTEGFEWDNPALLWEIMEVEGGYNLRNHATKLYFTPTNVSTGAGDDRIGTTEQPSVFTINYTGDQSPSQTGLSTAVSMYRINSPSNRDQQIRARGFADDWIWGSGTFDRADMVFTFTEVSESDIPLYVLALNEKLASAQAMATDAKADVTLGYPQESIDALKTVVAEAEAFAGEVANGQHTQADVDSVVAVLTRAIADMKATCIYTFMGFDTNATYTIYSYGTMSNANTTSATTDVQRRYLFAMKNYNSQQDSLVYRIGASDDEISAGKSDVVARLRAALWTFEAGENGTVYVRNQQCGAYMQISNYLSATPATIRPYYAKHDNGKMAFYMDADETGKLCFNVGNPTSDGKGGPLGFFTAHADRVRLRWVIEKSSIKPLQTSIEQNMADGVVQTRYYNMQGQQLDCPPRSGIFLEQVIAPDGSQTTYKRMK